MNGSYLLAYDVRNAYFQSAPSLNLPASQPGNIISLILPNVIVLAGVVFFFLILFGGFGIIIGAGRHSSPQEAAKAKSALTYGVIGFLLVVSAYFILQIVSAVFGVNFMKPLP